MNKYTTCLIGSLFLHPAFKDFCKRAHPDLLQSQAGCQRFFLADRSAVQGAEKIIQQTLTGGGIVENIADKRGSLQI